MNTAFDVAICIPTHRRNPQLIRLLEGLLALRSTHGPAPRIATFVIDNTPSGEARLVAEDPRWHTLNLHYAVEQRIGIPFARNRCIDLAAPLADWIAFIDDDEVPAPDWIENLMRAQAVYGLDVVAGPVLPRFSREPPSWIPRGYFHGSGAWLKRPIGPRIWGTLQRRVSGTSAVSDGTPLRGAAAGNVLFSSRLATEAKLRFDESMGRFGFGEDSLYFLQAAEAGYRIGWTNSAAVYHAIPSYRVKLRWLLRQSFQNGICRTLVAKRAGKPPAFVAAIAGRALGSTSASILLSPLAALQGRHALVSVLMRITLNAGIVSAAFGRTPDYDRDEAALSLRYDKGAASTDGTVGSGR